MASIIKQVHIDASPEDVWDALCDFGAMHDRLAAGFVTDTRLEGERTRLVTFANGAVAREVLIGLDGDARRLAYAVVESRLGFTHHSASAEVRAERDGCCFVWTSDVLPDSLGPQVEGLMSAGIACIKAHLEQASG